MNSSSNNLIHNQPSKGKVCRMNQKRIVISIKEKCGLIDHLYDGIKNWTVNIHRTDSNNEFIEELLSSTHRMLSLINDDNDYMDAAYEIEKVLLLMNRFKEASMLYGEFYDRIDNVSG